METKASLPFSKQISYAIDQFGWSLLINVISLALVYFYLPPKDARLPYLITQVTFLGVLNAITLIAAFGRLFDAIVDPIVASWSDGSKNLRGWRIPFMLAGAIPATVFFVLMFLPPVREVSPINIIWLMSLVFLAVYFLGRFPFDNQLQAYLVVITYAVPLSFLSVLPNATLAEIEHDALRSGERKEGMFFAARTLMQKFGQTFGILIFAMLTSFGKDIGDDLGIRLSGLAGFGLCLLAGIVFTRYNEKRLLDETAQMQAAVAK